MNKMLNVPRKSDWQDLHDIAMSVYLNRLGHEFSVALHRGLGWPIVGLMNGTIVGRLIRHTLVCSPDGKLWDVRGEISLNDVNAPFGEYDFILEHSIAEERLRNIRPLSEDHIKFASYVARELWPGLPWKIVTNSSDRSL